jgi:hypothetical protein
MLIVQKFWEIVPTDFGRFQGLEFLEIREDKSA